MTQAGPVIGVVTSVPTGISCGTGLNICASDFAEGTRVVLRASADAFRGWRSVCDENTGGASLECVVVITQARTIEVDFGLPPPPQQQVFALSFAVQGPGSVRADGGIDCSETANGAAVCQRDFAVGTVVNVRAVPASGATFLGWSGEANDTVCRSLLNRTDVQITVQRNLRCFAQFAGPVTAPDATLEVQVVNGATGRLVDSSPVGIRCTGDAASDCSESYAAGTPVILRASAPGFLNWQGCDQVQDITFCHVNMQQSRGVTATYAP